MNNCSVRFVFDRKNETGYKKKVKGKKYKEVGLLQIEVRKDGTDKRVYISANIHIKPDQYSDKNGFTCKNHDSAKRLTGKAHDIFRKVEAFVMSEKCKDMTYVKYWDSQELANLTIIEFIESELSRKNVSMSVIKTNAALISRLKEYGKMNTFEDITYNNIIGFDAHLRKTITSEPTLYKRHSLFKGYINEAINRGIYNGVNPYNLFKPNKGKSKDPIFLNEDEIELIKEYSPDFGYLERTRDLFLFQCYTGLSYADLMKFDKDVVQDIDGDKVIRSNRQKTDESYIIYLFPEAEAIAEKYKYNLPKLTNQKYNEYLKIIASGAGINKQLTSHSARHTFATYLINKNIPIESVSRALGHSNIKQTQHYAKLIGKKVIDDMKQILKPKTPSN